MERRKESRAEVSQEVTVTVLGEYDAGPFRAETVEMSGSGMRILSPYPVAYQAVVKVQAGDLLLLGEVVRVEMCEQGYMVALKLEHAVNLMGDLYRLNQSLREEQKTERVTANNL